MATPNLMYLISLKSHGYACLISEYIYCTIYSLAFHFQDSFFNQMALIWYKKTSVSPAPQKNSLVQNEIFLKVPVLAHGTSDLGFLL